ncbi:hypothetical protein CMV_018892 [Castanea mollissima]|uniref:Uncharacterized protein n=1 Tax=Castanea mollissima TaxID=60419 RepID=A0A8J4VC49_9ROSI|nr:hypothetical protein CMV_018892 [Castanea mollissima]
MDFQLKLIGKQPSLSFKLLAMVDFNSAAKQEQKWTINIEGQSVEILATKELMRKIGWILMEGRSEALLSESCVNNSSSQYGAGNPVYLGQSSRN